MTLIKIEESAKIALCPKDNPFLKSGDFYLHKTTFEALNMAMRISKEMGYKIQLHGALRSEEEQRKLWTTIKDSRYVVNPESPKGASHCHGMGVDVSLIEIKSNKNLNFGSEVYNFSEVSDITSQTIMPSCIMNRMLLWGIMSTAGFVIDTMTWWGFKIANQNKDTINI